MKKTILIMTILFLGTGFNLYASEQVKLLNEDSQAVTLNFRLGDFFIRNILIEGNSCVFPQIRDGAVLQKKGAPALPFITQSIIIPDFSDMELVITDVDYYEITTKRILPSRGPVRMGRNPEKIPLKFGKIYNRDEWYPQDFAKLGRPYILRGHRGQVVFFYPFLYNPVQGRLKIAESITVTVKKTGYSPINMLSLPHSKTPAVYDDIYRRHFINYRQHRDDFPALSEAGNMIIITPEKYITAVEPMVEWKNRKGIKTDLYLYPKDTGTSYYEIKSFIRNIYDTTGLTYILIIGDAEDVPPGIGTLADAVGDASDPVYTLLAGDDNYADAMIGRFSVETLNQARTVVNKNLWYEKNPNPHDDWYHKTAGIIDFDRYFTPSTHEHMEEIRDMLLAYNYTEFTRIYAPDITPVKISFTVNQGRGWINVLHHGTSYGWVELVNGELLMHFSSTDVSQLRNSFKTPVVIGSSCGNGTFAGKTCFAEFWQRQGTPEKPQGSIIYLGANTSIWHLSWVAVEAINQYLVQEEYKTAGGLITNGLMKMIDYFPDGPYFEGPETFQLWHLFGDPSLLVYTDTPIKMEAAFAATLPQDSAGFQVTVKDKNGPLSDARVALYMNSTLFGSALSDENGTAEITLNEDLPQSGTMEVNITAFNKIPYFGTVKIK